MDNDDLRSDLSPSYKLLQDPPAGRKDEPADIEELMEDIEPVPEEVSPGSGYTAITSFEVNKGKAADVAYLARENSGDITPEAVSVMSRNDEYSEVTPVSRKDANEALRALSLFGLVDKNLPDMEETETFDYSTEDLLTKDPEEPDTSLSYNTDLGDLSLEYSTGRPGELKNPDHKIRHNVSSPEEAFQRIGEMQEKYDFERGIYRSLEENLS